MTDQNTAKTPKIALISAICGVVAFLGLLWVAEYSTVASLIVAVLVALLVAILLWIGWYEDEAAPHKEGHPSADVSRAGAMATASVGDEPMSLAEELDRDVHPADVTEEPVAGATVAAKPVVETVEDVVSEAVEPEVVEEVVVEPVTSVEVEVVEPETAVETPVASADGKPGNFLSAAREGGPDDLKLIKGVGPKLEALLHEMGVYHFDQIAVWGAADVAYMDENLQGFKGRVTRDDWVGQAKALAKAEG